MARIFKESYIALLYDELEEYEAVIEELTIHLQENRSNIYALNNRGVAYWEIGKRALAKKDLEKVMEIGVTNGVPIHNLGQILEEEGELDSALLLYDQAIDLWPAESSCYLTRAYAFLKAEKWSEAITDFDKAIEIGPSWKQTYLSRAKAKAKNGDILGSKIDIKRAENL